MVSTAARLALRRRALRAASWLDLWAGRLLDELKKQNIDLYPRQGDRQGDSTDYDLITITLERRDIEQLIRGMRECAEELLQFAK
jgi:hypothetical protein